MWFDFDDYAEIEAIVPGLITGSFYAVCESCGNKYEIERTGDNLFETITCPDCGGELLEI